MLNRRLIEEESLSQHDRDMIQSCTRAEMDYLHQTQLVRTLASASKFFAWLPFVGNFFLDQLDEAMDALGRKWGAFQCLAAQLELVFDEDFGDARRQELREALDEEWAPPRCIILPSD